MKKIIVGIGVMVSVWYSISAIDTRGATAMNDAAMFAPYLDTPGFRAAWNLYTAGNYEAAYTQFLTILRERPGDEGVNMAMALCAQKTGRLSQATLAYERILSAQPGNLRARAELGRLYAEMKQYGLARASLQAVLDARPEPQVATTVRRLMDAIDDAQRQWRFSARADAGAFYDSNVNAGPRAATIEISPISTGAGSIDSLTVSAGSQPAGVWGGFASLSPLLIFDPGRQGGWNFTAAGTWYNTWLSEHHAYELLFYGASASAVYAGRDFSIQIPVRSEHLSRGHDDLVNIYAVAPVYTFEFSRSWLALVRGTYEKRDYYDLEQRDADYVSGAPYLTYVFPAGHRITAGGALFGESADAAYYSNDGWEMSLAAEFNIAQKTLLYGKGLYRETRYDERETLAPETRRDNQWQAVAGLRRFFTLLRDNDFAIDLGYQHIDTRSTFELYENRRDIVTLGSTWRF